MSIRHVWMTKQKQKQKQNKKQKKKKKKKKKKTADQMSCSSPETICSEQAYGNIF